MSDEESWELKATRHDRDSLWSQLQASEVARTAILSDRDSLRAALEAIAEDGDVLPCGTCGKPHELWDTGEVGIKGTPYAPSWRSKEDGHPLRRMSPKQFAAAALTSSEKERA